MNNDFRPQRPAKAIAAALKQKPLSSELETPFETPEVVAAHDEPKKPIKLLAAPRKLHWWLKSLTKKQLALVLAIAVLLVAGVSYGSYALLKKKPAKEAPVVMAPKKEEPPKPTTVASRMTGVQVAPELNELPVTGVMIENSPDARPQSGLAQADMVFEAIAEGGITRFLALYQESKPDYIGPVRSVRPYYLDFLGPYDAAIAHAGGSSEALAQLKAQGFKDLDQFANGGSYQRVSTRYAPHNLYTSRDKLLALQTSKGFTSSTYTGVKRKDKETPSPAPNAHAVDFNISGFLYNPRFDYDAATNTYKRSLAGKPHVDEKTGAQIAPKVVVGLVMSHHYAGIYSVYGTTGSGVAYFFQDGTMTQGIWEKSDRKGQFTFKDSAGAVFPLDPGQTWFTVVAGTDRVKVTP